MLRFKDIPLHVRWASVLPFVLSSSFVRLNAEAMAGLNAQDQLHNAVQSNVNNSSQFEPLTDMTIHDDAVMLLAKHIAASSPWTSLRIKGSVTLPGADKPASAELVLQNLNQAILKIDQSVGVTSIAVEGAFRKTNYADGTTVVDSSTPGPAGLLPLQLLHSPDLPTRLLALKIVGRETVEGVLCDKLSLRYLLTNAKPAEKRIPHNIQVDFYLDTTTHRIVQSVSSLRLPGLAQPELQKTVYSDYATLGGVVFPTRIIQTIGGQPLWDLSVTSVSSESKIDSKEFTK